MAMELLRLVSLCCLLATAAFGDEQAPSFGSCYETVTKAPRVCGAEFIQAIFAGADKRLIGDVCCEYLACVHEASCVAELRKICSPKVMASNCQGLYPLPPQPPALTHHVSTAING